mgnify:CR=1 FL=1|jgi:Carbohydrate binding domain.
MSTSISRSALLCSLFACLTGLSGCSDNDPADVSFQERDTTEVATNIIPNPVLEDGDAGWDTDVDATNGAYAEFDLAPTLGQGGQSLKTTVEIVEVDSNPGDIYAGPAAVQVQPGQAYGVAAYVDGPFCGLTRFVVKPVGSDDPEEYLASQNIFLTGQPQMVELYFQVPAGVTSVDMPVQMGFAENIGGEFFIDRIVAMPLPSMPPVQEGNVARNSDFEESDTAINVGGSWGQSGSGATFILDTTPGVAQNGNNAVRIEFAETVGTGNPWDIEAGPVGVPVVSGWTYVFSAWVKGDGGKINFLVQNPTQYNVFAEQATEVITSEWQEVRFEAKIEGTGTVRLYAQYNFPENSGKTIYVDNIRLIPPDTCPYVPMAPDMVSGNASLFEYDHVTNGGLEEDAIDFLGWATKATNSAVATFDMQIVPDKFNRILVNKGNQSLRASITTATANPADIQAGPADIYVVPGQTYTYSGFARGPVGAKAQFVPVLQDAPATALEGYLVTFANIWQQVTFDFAVPASAPVLTEEELEEAGLPADSVVTRLQLAVNMSFPENEGKHIFLDDFSLLPNAIVNGDLEDSAEGWTIVAPTDIATTALDTANAHSGHNSLRFSFSRNAANLADDSDPESFLLEVDDVQAAINNIPVAGGRKYYVSGRFNGDAGARVTLLLSAADGSKVFASANSVELNGGWQEITFTANVPEGVEEVNLIAQLGHPVNALRTIRLDTFRLVSQIPPPPRAKAANVVSNGDFETGASTGWSGNNATVTLISTSDTPEGVYSGRYALRVSDRQATWASAQFDLGDSALTAGDSYFAAAWVKVDGEVADTLKMTLLVEYQEGSPDYVSITNSGTANTLNWMRLSGIFTFNPGAGRTVKSIKPYIEATKAETNYFIDELVITKIYNVNGGFETGDLSEWTPAGATVTVVTDEVHSGANAARVTGRSANWHSAQYDMSGIGLVPGRTYLMSAWVKNADAVAEPIKMTVQIDSNYRTIAQSSALEWTQLSNTFTYSSEASTLKVYFESDGNGNPATYSSYYIDDLIITEFVPPTSIITNGDLEAGTADGWNASGGETAISVAQWPQGGAHSGFFGLQVTGRTENWHSAQYSLLSLELEENTSYKASVWVKLAAGGLDSDTVNLTLLLDDGRAAPWIPVASATVGQDGWTKLEGVFDYTPTGAVTDLRLYVEAAGPNTAYFIDDLVVARNFAFNGRLEASATDAIGWSQAGADLTVTTEDSQSGQALFVSNRSANWASAQYDLRNSGMLPGRTYDISAWVKIAGEEAERISMTLQSGSSTYTRLDSSVNTESWVKLSARYVLAAEEMPEVFKIYFETEENVTTSYYVDSLVITEVNESYTH